MRRLAINSGDAFILVYSVDEPQSLDELEQLRETILSERELAAQEAGDQHNQGPLSSSSTSSSGLASGGASQASIGLAMAGATGALATTITCANSLHPNQGDQQQAPQLSPSRHWSLASLFNHHHHHNHHHHNHHQSQLINPSAPGGASSLSSSSFCSSSASSSADNSRRSSISAAEAALKTRRTRRPPMVIVANKHDLPKDKHLVNSDEIEALALIDWNNGFVRASAALNWNIEEIFQQVLKQARQPPTLTEAIASKRRKSLPPKLPHT